MHFLKTFYISETVPCSQVARQHRCC